MIETMPQDIDRPDPLAFVRRVTESANLAEEMKEAQLSEIGQQVIADYQLDKESMSDWLERMSKAIELAKLVKKDRNYPFKNSANIKYPLVTSAALQFNARAYPAIVQPDRPVKAKVWGADAGGKKAARADRISEHMSFQLSAEIKEWTRQTDSMLLQLAIVGTMVRKWWYDEEQKRPRCRLIAPGKFIVNESATDLATVPRCTEEISLYPHEVETRKRIGSFSASFELDDDGVDKQALEEFIEQHTLIDLDGDGYPEPYIVTMHVDTAKVVRIVADFEESDVSFKTEQRPMQAMSLGQDPYTGMPVQIPTIQMQDVPVGITGIQRGQYFEAFHMLPSMDGGFFGTGLGILLGDISSSINTIINMLLNSGHYSSLGGGFIGSEARMKGGAQRLRPGEWRMVSGTGQDLRSALVPVNFQEPSPVLFSLLGMLIDAGREIASVKDVVTGETPSHQQTATTTLALIEQGMMVFTAAYKRIFDSCKAEYRMLAKINARTLDPQKYSAFHDMMSEQQQGPDGQMLPPQQQVLDPRADYDFGDMDVMPVADPQTVTKMQRAAKAQLVLQLAGDGLVAPGPAMERVAEAMDIEDVEELLPPPDPMAEQMAAITAQMAQADLAAKMAEVELTMAKVEETRTQALENMASAQTDQARMAHEQLKTRLDGLKVILDDSRQRMEALRRTDGGVEGAPSDREVAAGNVPGVGPAGAGLGAVLPQGATAPGGGPAGLGLGPGSI
jgi:chaperonin GroES